MEVFLIKALQLILSLSILVVLHEAGHFIPAKLFKTRVEKFYLFFDPWFSLFKFKRGGTEYGIGWLPLGGYVKISGMIDESMDKEQMEKPAEPWEFRAKPVWQRLIIMVGGVTVNMLLAFVIYAMVLFTWGKEYLPVENATYGVVCDSTLHEYGFKDGDKIIAVGGSKPETFSQISKDILINTERTITISRNGAQQDIVLPNNIEEVLLNNNIKSMFFPRVPFVIDTILPGSPASESALKKGDKMLAFNGQESIYFNQFQRFAAENKGKVANLEVERKGDNIIVEVSVGEDGKVGVGNQSPSSFFEFKKQEYGFFESIPAGYDEGISVLSSYASSLKLIFTSAGIKHMGGFGTFGSLFSPTWNWQNFWMMTAFISVILAFMNILPIPALDGGHVMFLMYEMITRRKPNEKVMEYAQVAGMVLLLTLVLYANGNDLFRAFQQ